MLSWDVTPCSVVRINRGFEQHATFSNFGVEKWVYIQALLRCHDASPESLGKYLQHGYRTQIGIRAITRCPYSFARFIVEYDAYLSYL